MHAFPAVNRIVYPYVIVFQVVPKVALAPIFITWFGFGLTSKVVMAATISFFPTLVNTVAGLGAVEEEALLLFRSLVVRRHQAFFKLALPRSLGGLECDPLTIIRVIEELARADGSGGWTVMIGNTTAFTARTSTARSRGPWGSRCRGRT